jgi:putative phosphonate metabolism protein
MRALEGWRRHALYWMPEPGPLAAFAARWLGWDAEAGEAPAHPEIAGLPLAVEAITRTPRKYGFHGTVKPPFRLAAGQQAGALDCAARALCAGLGAVSMPGLELRPIGAFLALVPRGDPTALAALAARVVAGLDAFRAAPDANEIARRNPDALTPRQRALLDRWGYPYVMEEFRFHLTLTGALPDGARAAVAAALEPQLRPLLPAPFAVRGLALCGEGDDGRFRLLRRYPLGG